MSESEGDRLGVIEHCPTCGAAVKVVSDALEGTSHYRPLRVSDPENDDTLREQLTVAVEENTKLRAAIVLARMQLDRLPVSPRLLMVRDGLDAALGGQ